MIKKHLLVLIPFMFFVLHSFGRYKSDRTDSDTTIATIELDNMNLMYIDIDNPLTIAVPGVNPSQITASSSGGGTFKIKSINHYLFHPDGSVRQVSIILTMKMADGSDKIICKKEFNVRKIPHPEVLFGTFTGGAFTKEQIMAVKRINCGFPEGIPFYLTVTVKSYTIIIIPEKGDSYVEKVSGNTITEASKARLNNLNSGDRIVITDVAAAGPAGDIHVSSVVITVK